MKSMPLSLTFFRSLCFIILFFSIIPASYAQVVINEYSAANRNINTDAFGENEDWIELYNAGATDYDLTNHYISDRANNPTKWQFPSGTVPAGGYLMVWCSKRDGINLGEHHTNFKLTQTNPNEVIMLTTPAGVVLDSISLIPAKENTSRGRSSDGGATWTVFDTPTPNTTNPLGSEDYGPTPEFDMAPGFYTGSVTVALTSSDPGATIHYTTNGDEPTAASPTYSTPITVTQTTAIRAIGINSDPDVLPSFIETNTYFIDEVHAVKVVSLAGDEIDNLLAGNFIEPQAHFELFHQDGTLMDEALGEFNKHGNDSWAYDQRGLDYITRDEFGYNNEIKGEIFPGKDRDGFQRLILKAAASDNYPFENGGAHIRDAYVSTLSQLADLKLDERTHESCVMYVNGEYWGVYELREKVDDADFTRKYYDQDEYDLQFLKTWGMTWEEYGGPNAEPAWDDLVNFITTNDMSIQTNYDSAKSQLNMLSLIDYFMLNSLTVCQDWLNWNTAWWRGTNPDGDKKKWRYALWDMDATFGHYINFTGIPDTGPSADPCNVESLPDPGGQGHTTIMTSLLANDEFSQLYISRYIDLTNTTFNCTRMIEVLDSLVDIIDPEMTRQCNRWGGTYNGWQNNVQDIRDFINARCIDLEGGLVDCYNLDGPYDVKFKVDPPLSGKIKINSVVPDTFDFSGTYYGGIDILLEAQAEPGYSFDYWEVFGNPVAPNDTSVNVTWAITSADSVVAHFSKDSSEYVIIVDPPLSGQVDFNLFTIPTYPYTTAVVPESNVALGADPFPGFTFDFWELSNNTVSPGINFDDVIMVAEENDTIIAHFTSEPQNFVFRVEPPLSGDITINQTVTPSSYPHSDTYFVGDAMELWAIPQSDYEFDFWQTNNHTLIPGINDDSVNFGVFTTDTIVAHFVERPYLTVIVTPENSGNVTLNGNFLIAYPHLEQFGPAAPIAFVASPAEGFLFAEWQLTQHSVQPNVEAPNAQATLVTSDTLYAVFYEEGVEPEMPTIFTPNNDNQNDRFALESIANILEPELVIFDRWGRVIERINDLQEGWDGTQNGRQMQDGTYFYSLSYQNRQGEAKQVSGYVTLVR